MGDQNTAAEFTKEVERFFANLKDYGLEHRPGQTEMVHDITQAINEHKNLIVEAGVAIGKSFGYLVPGILYNKLYQKPVIIATATIALQEQLSSDIDTVSKMLGYSVEKMLAKGKTHFLCYKRAKNYLVNKTDPQSAKIRVCFASGDFDRKDYPNMADKIWNQINVSDDRAMCLNCSEAKRCKYKKHKEKLMGFNGIILCNQDLLTIHLMQKKQPIFNKEIAVVVVDEAHNLEEKVRKYKTKKYSKNTAENIMDAVIKMIIGLCCSKPNSYLLLCSNLRRFFGRLAEHVQDQIKSSEYGDAERFFINIEESNTKKAVAELISDLKNVEQKIGSNNQDYGVRQFQEMIGFLSGLMDEAGDNIYWVEKTVSTSENLANCIEICACPKNMGSEIHNLYFGRDFVTILTSATIANQGNSNAEKYAYITKNMGFPKSGLLSAPKPSPFDYDNNAMLYYCGDLPHPKNRDEFIKEGTQRISELLEISNGKALVLFTSKSDMEEVYTILKSKVTGFNILIQSSQASQKKLLETFKADVSSVLLGTGSFWEGIDITGVSLSNLIIFRLPFPVPDPVYQYKASITADGLIDVYVPAMLIKLRQGVGRLLRSETDKGIVSILDPRLGESFERPYREAVFKSLPIKTKTKDLKDLRDFFESKCHT